MQNHGSNSESAATRPAIPARVAKIILAADGYMDLGMFSQAQEELDLLPPEFKDIPEVYPLRFRLAAGVKNWAGAVEWSLRLIQVVRDNAELQIMHAYAVRRAVGLEQARTILLNAAERFPKTPTIYYNLACYECQLGNITGAEQYLARAFVLNEDYRKMAVEDEDLIPLWEKLKSNQN